MSAFQVWRTTSPRRWSMKLIPCAHTRGRPTTISTSQPPWPSNTFPVSVEEHGAMKSIAITESIDVDRRRFVGTAAMIAAAAELGIVPAAKAQSVKQRAAASLGQLKQIDAGPLSIGYAEAGPAGGAVVILLHGWPYDIHSYAEVMPILEANGFRVIVPYLRGYGSTRFLASETPRNGQQAALADDVVALMDALKIRSAIIGGWDWGARTANIVAALPPDRCQAMVSVSGYLIGSQAANRQPSSPEGRAVMVVSVLL